MFQISNIVAKGEMSPDRFCGFYRMFRFLFTQAVALEECYLFAIFFKILFQFLNQASPLCSFFQESLILWTSINIVEYLFQHPVEGNFVCVTLKNLLNLQKGRKFDEQGKEKSRSKFSK